MSGHLTKAVGNAIGLASEYNAHRKASNSAAPNSRAPSGSEVPPKAERERENATDDSTDQDEEDWELDDVQREQAAPDSLSGNDGRDVDEVLKAFFNKHPPPPYSEAVGRRLPCPVILPQRRPQMNTRGFVRAYAPVLQDCGIDQGTWMDFLNGFHKAIKMSPYFHATNAAVLATAITLQVVAGPSIAIHMAAMAMHISVEASRRGYTRYQTNKYIDIMNDKVFKPRGLYAMIMTYKPTSSSKSEVVDLNSTITQAITTRSTPTTGTSHSLAQKFKQSSGQTHGDLQLPVAAPLIFPALDALPDTQKESAFQKSGAFLGDYFDRRAQAKFEVENPDSKLNVAPRKDFASRFSDPTHAVYSGGIATFVSGGAVQGGRRRGRREGRRNPGAAQQQQDGNQTAQTTGERSGLMGTLRKSLKENVLYLMVVNLPSDEEMRQVSREFEKKN